jgi:hypothetical protein
MTQTLQQPNRPAGAKVLPKVALRGRSKRALVAALGRQSEQFSSAFGVDNTPFAASLIEQVKGTAAPTQGGRPCVEEAFALVQAIGPKDALEAMLVVQMVGTHNLAMEFLRRAAQEAIGCAPENAEMATKMLRTFTAQTEALNRLRGKGQQKVIVEHVTVNQGGQAVVGAINHQGAPRVGG